MPAGRPVEKAPPRAKIEGMRARRLLGAAAVLLVAACDTMYMASPGEPGAQLELLSLSEGGFLQSDEPIRFRVEAGPGAAAPETLIISVNDATGESVWETVVDNPPANEDIELEALDPLELETGSYQLVFTLIDANGLESVRRRSFYLVHGSYAIDGIQSFPPVGRTGGSTLLAAQVTAPDGSDPFLVWSSGGSVFAQAALSEIGNQALWKAPGRPGIYSVTLSLFPVDPQLTGDLPFFSPADMTASLYVVDRASAVADLAAYFSLLLLDGDLVDSAGSAAGAPAPTVDGDGSLTAAPIGEDLGVVVEPELPIRFMRLLIPAAGDPPGPFGFTLLLDLMRAEADAGGTIIEFRGVEDATILRLALTEEGTATVTVGDADAPTLYGDPVHALAPGVPARLGLSAAIREDVMDLSLYQDGLQIGTATGIATPDLAAGTTLVGGSGSFTGVLGQLATYYRNREGTPALYPHLLQEHLRGADGEILFAFGMDGLQAAPELALEGEPTLQAGRLTLPAGSAVTLPPVPATGFSELSLLLVQLSQPWVRVTTAASAGDGPMQLILTLADALEDAESQAGLLQVEAGTQLYVRVTEVAGAQGVSIASSLGSVSQMLPAETRELQVVLRAADGAGASAVIDMVVAQRPD